MTHTPLRTAAALAALGLVAAVPAQANPDPNQPDLVVDLNGPAATFAGADIGPQVHLFVKNIGQALATGTAHHRRGYMVDLTLGRDLMVPPGFHAFAPNFGEDVLLRGGRVSVTDDLPPVASRHYVVGAKIPDDTPPGNYQLCASVDPGDAVAESDEVHNYSCRRLRILRRGVNVGPQEDLPGNQFR